MTGLWIITGCLIFLTLVLAVVGLIVAGGGSYGRPWPGRIGWGMVIVGLCTVVFAFVAVVMTITAYVDRANCASWQDQTGRESKFVFYTPVTWDCLAKTQDGTWLPKEQLREFGEDAG